MTATEQTAYVAGTFNTKGAELGYLAERLKAAGLTVCTVDLGTGELTSSVTTDISASDVAAYHPSGPEAVLNGHDRGQAVVAMSEAFRLFLAQRQDVSGIIGAGGSGGTALLAPAMRELAVGVPKVLVSTMASGDVAPYVGASDITMMYSVTDVEGLNPISRRILANAAHALAGMLRQAHEIDTTSGKPALGLTMFGVTTPCVKAVADQLGNDYDCLVFHATGTGGRSMEKLADSNLLAGVLDITTTEIADMLVGGVLAATEDRMGAVIRQRLPYVGSVGALDMVNFGARDTVPEKFADRLFHIHNPQITLMRTTVEENKRFGEWIATRLNEMQGPVRFLLPMQGVSMLDAEGQAFHNPEADAALFDTLEANVKTKDYRQLIRIDAHINDERFVEALVTHYRSIAC